MYFFGPLYVFFTTPLCIFCTLYVFFGTLCVFFWTPLCIFGPLYVIFWNPLCIFRTLLCIFWDPFIYFFGHLYVFFGPLYVFFWTHWWIFCWRLMWGWLKQHTGRPLPPGERSSKHCTGGWVGPRAGLDRCGKSRLQPGFDPQIVQPVASHYNDWAIQVSFETDSNMYKSSIKG